MRLREIVVYNEENFIYGWQTLETEPQRFGEFIGRVQKWLDENDFKIGEGKIEADVLPPYIGETVRRMEYNLTAPRISGGDTFPCVVHIDEDRVR